MKKMMKVNMVYLDPLAYKQLSAIPTYDLMLARKLNAIDELDLDELQLLLSNYKKSGAKLGTEQ